MTKERPKVFLSSTIRGNEDLRAALDEFFEVEKKYSVVSYGDRTRGILTGNPGIERECLNGVKTSDLYFLIVDKKYGKMTSTYKRKKISLTEREFYEAVNNQIKIFIFCRYEVWILNKYWEENKKMKIKQVDPDYDRPLELMTFLSKMKSDEHMITPFLTIQDLKETLKKISFALDHFKNEVKIIDEGEQLEVVNE